MSPAERLGHVEARIFDPLHMTSCGFGAPGTAGTVEEPWGHHLVGGQWQPMDPGAAGSDNPPALALTGYKDSASFEVDNAPPVLTASLVQTEPATIRAVARDAGTAIRRLEVSVDAGRWLEVYPTDGINDSKEETYQFPVPSNGGSAPRVVVLRVSDRLGNVATGRVDVP